MPRVTFVARRWYVTSHERNRDKYNTRYRNRNRIARRKRRTTAIVPLQPHTHRTSKQQPSRSIRAPFARTNKSTSLVAHRAPFEFELTVR
jgi:hypothetical protein